MREEQVAHGAMYSSLMPTCWPCQIPPIGNLQAIIFYPADCHLWLWLVSRSSHMEADVHLADFCIPSATPLTQAIIIPWLLQYPFLWFCKMISNPTLFHLEHDLKKDFPNPIALTMSPPSYTSYLLWLSLIWSAQDAIFHHSLVTLSSKHLPFLIFFFSYAAPQIWEWTISLLFLRPWLQSLLPPCL